MIHLLSLFWTLWRITICIATKQTEELLGQIFWSPNSASRINVVPMNSVFNRLLSSVRSEGAEPCFQTSQAAPTAVRTVASNEVAQPCGSAFDRLQYQLAQERTSAFDRLQIPTQLPPGLGRLYPRCLLHGHLRHNCWNQIRCHGCNKSGHIKRDCRTTLKNIWIPK
jgi:hypothetical protein